MIERTSEWKKEKKDDWKNEWINENANWMDKTNKEMIGCIVS